MSKVLSISDNLAKTNPFFFQLRLILYFPISSLVTLFANILQNPLDARARSDVKLMNLVVNFLQILATDESNGSVKRMLNICTEFERIAKIVLERAEKDSQTRRKRKTADEDNYPIPTTQQNGSAHQQNETQTSGPPPQPLQSQSMNTQSPFNSPFPAHAANPQLNTTTDGFPSPHSAMQNAFNMGDDAAFGHAKAASRLNQELSELLGGPTMNNADIFNPPQSLPNNESAPIDVSSFQQPFVPQDLWQMPMTLEWDWADMSNGFPYNHGEGEQ